MVEFERFGLEIADRPSLRNVAAHMFRLFDEEDRVYCISCGQVTANTSTELALHFDDCKRNKLHASECLTFECGPCDVTANGLIQWYYHLGTDGHLERWRRRSDHNGDAVASDRSANGHRQSGKLYSYDCPWCKTLVYDTESSVEKHSCAQNRRRSVAEAPLPAAPPSIGQDVLTEFMAYVCDAHTQTVAGRDDLAIIFCSRCKQWERDRLQQHKHRIYQRSSNVWRFPGVHYCDTCRVAFVDGVSEYKRHLLTAEHGTLLGQAVRKRRSDLTDSDMANGFGNVPRVAMRHFARSTLKMVCKLCNDRVWSNDKKVLEHFNTCEALTSMRPTRLQLPRLPFGMTAADYNGFRCTVCAWSSSSSASAFGPAEQPLDEWTEHVFSESHPKTCGRMREHAYHECTKLLVLYYGSAGPPPCGCNASLYHRPFGLADVMRYVYDEINSVADGQPSGPTFFYWQKTGNYGRCDRSADPASVPHYCPTCRLEFYGTRTAFRQHAVTAEHLLLQRFAPDKTTFSADAAAIVVDDDYGRNVAVRLNAIRDPSLKSHVKTAIDTVLDLTSR